MSVATTSRGMYQPPFTDIRRVIEHFNHVSPQKTFAVFPETGEYLNYAQLREGVLKYSYQLSVLKVKKGDTVSFMLSNGQTTLTLFLACLYYGCVSSPLNPAAGPEQIEYVLDHSDTKLVFVSEKYRAQIERGIQSLTRDVTIVDCEANSAPQWAQATSHLNRSSSHRFELPSVSALDDALLMYTSGTTGRPKGVILTHKNLLAGGMNTAVAHELVSTDRGLCVLPLCHINAQCVTVMAPLVSGGSVVMPQAFSVSKFWQWVIEHQVNWFSVVPTIISYLMHHQGELADAELKVAIDHVKFGRSASAALPPAMHAGFEAKFGVPIIETMGLTETSAQILSNPMSPKAGKYGSPGIAFGTEIKIQDENGRELSIGEEGELMVRGDCVMRCYYKNTEATAAALTPDGWLHTGDLAKFDQEGFVFITGRLKELIIKGGENIAPREIDDVLYSHPDIVEAGAVGIDDEHYGQEVVACVVIKEDVNVCEQQLIDFCFNKLGKIKTPKNIYFFNDLPKGPSGKVQRLKLVEQLKLHQVH